MRCGTWGVALLFALLALPLPTCAGSETEPYRMLVPEGDGRHPAVLLVPGCSGFVASNGINLYDERAEELQAARYLVVFVDYVGRRNLRDCAHVSHAEVGQDILEAAAWTRDQPGVDADRIAVIGWSYGGGGVLAALTAMSRGTPIIAKAVMYYPDCRGAKPWSASRVAVLMLLGAIDDVARPAVCEAAMKGVSPDRLRIITYPNARHAFDVRGLPEHEELPFGSVGYNANAAKASWAAVVEFMRAPFASALPMLPSR